MRTLSFPKSLYLLKLDTAGPTTVREVRNPLPVFPIHIIKGHSPSHPSSSVDGYLHEQPRPTPTPPPTIHHEDLESPPPHHPLRIRSPPPRPNPAPGTHHSQLLVAAQHPTPRQRPDEIPDASQRHHGTRGAAKARRRALLSHGERAVGPCARGQLRVPEDPGVQGRVRRGEVDYGYGEAAKGECDEDSASGVGCEDELYTRVRSVRLFVMGH